MQRLQNDLSAPWDNKSDADKWNKPDWSFLANFPAIPNSAAAGAAGASSEKQKEAIKVRTRGCMWVGMGGILWGGDGLIDSWVLYLLIHTINPRTQAARAYDAYMAFLESNPGVALPSSAAPPAPAVDETATTPTTTEPTAPTEAEKEPATETPASETPTSETPASEPATDSTDAKDETPTTPTEPAPVPEAAAPVCPEGETPLILYLDSGSTGEYEACTAETNGTASYYFVGKAGDSEARTFALPEVRACI